VYKITLLDITGFLGHLHPLIVHLPIGFLLLALVFDLLSYFSRFVYLKSAVSITLLAGFVAATLSCIFGYMLSLSGGYDGHTLTSHQYAGISLSIFAGLYYLATTASGKRLLHIPQKIFSFLFVALIGLMAYTGHEGGSLTHGNAYLTLETLTQEHRAKPLNMDSAMLFEDVVQPMLQSRCGQCHQSGRLKGRLSVKTLASLFKGGKHGPAVIPGNLLESELYKRITLEPDNEEYMPADGKTPLTKNEVAIIRWWIEKAGAAESKTIASVKGSDSIRPRVALYLGFSKTLPDETNDAMAQHINPDIPQTADNAVIEKLRSNGWMIRMMLHKPMMLDITLPAGSAKKMPEAKEDLIRLAKNIVWLNLAGNQLADKDLDFLQQCTNIEKLRLANNPVSDAIVDQLLALPHLEALNLNETLVTKQGLDKLEKNQAVKRIYSWKLASE